MLNLMSDQDNKLKTQNINYLSQTHKKITVCVSEDSRKR
jgi:hypothetical protein